MLEPFLDDYLEEPRQDDTGQDFIHREGTVRGVKIEVNEDLGVGEKRFHARAGKRNDTVELNMDKSGLKNWLERMAGIFGFK